MGIPSLTVLGMAALVAALAWILVAPSMLGWVPGAVELGSAAMFGIAAFSTKVSPRQGLSRRLAGIAQLSMLLVVAVPCAMAPGRSRIITLLTAPAAVAVLFSLFYPRLWDRSRWLKTYVFVCVLVAGILVALYSLLAAAISFGMAG